MTSHKIGIAMADEFGCALCKELGLDPNMVQSLNLNFEPGGCVTLHVNMIMSVKAGNALIRRARTYQLIQMSDLPADEHSRLAEGARVSIIGGEHFAREGTLVGYRQRHGVEHLTIKLDSPLRDGERIVFVLPEHVSTNIEGDAV